MVFFLLQKNGSEYGKNAEKDVLLQVKTEAFVTGEANKEGELSRINHATKTQVYQYGSISY